MTIEVISDITREALFLIIKVSLPVLLISMVVGLIVSIFQTVTSIQEQTLTFVPKIISIFLALILFGHWMLNNIVEYMTTLWSNFGIYSRG
ncbi:MAG: flagellar biosynthesis protein FliQ [Eubacterium sp.]|nr:flagellar biosynthesis protein FliQ [Eubacterium sp.]MCM1216231.1 flagellar biosynthesis protein FliQ [Lachnospiraceae bacterium]MCM1238849.1 flagellar biosynthesis protein FliQ [Lachnospiraceae bacterium]MCM1304906.1 flagellar biosynthesis protein FliQ [Butyrivibrio sp.]MCM1410094.1 flagellar biosynthesis protein FliQ [Lachnospiraceae bacterium]